jgi:hypothetical protein
MITDREAETLRAALTGDAETLRRNETELLQARETGLGVLTACALTLAARQHFSPQWSRADVIRFIGSMRAQNGGEYSDVDGSIGEQILLYALGGQPLPRELDEFAMGYAKLAILLELTRGFDQRRLDRLLADSRVLADE